MNRIELNDLTKLDLKTLLNVQVNNGFYINSNIIPTYIDAKPTEPEQKTESKEETKPKEEIKPKENRSKDQFCMLYWQKPHQKTIKTCDLLKVIDDHSLEEKRFASTIEPESITLFNA
jgi:hypothetical protein